MSTVPAVLETTPGRADVLDAAACREVAAAVHALRGWWVARDEVAFHTLGAALYLDAPRPETLARFKVTAPAPERYAREMARLNPVLRAHFAPLYAALAAALRALLGEDVRYAEDRALPGFHRFGAAAIYARGTAHVPHFDRQYECVAWPADADIDFARTISVTLPIRLPRVGGGLKVWDLALDEVLALGPAAARQRAASARADVHPYRIGELVCHPGHLLHQILPWQAEPGDERLTLQAHGVYYAGAWQLYW